MGGSPSADRRPSPEQLAEESTAASTGSLPFLRSAFSNLSAPNDSIPISSLQDSLSLNPTELASDSTPIPDQFTRLLPQIGPSVVSQFFPTSNSAASWIEFLRGYNKCCARSTSSSLNALFKLYSTACQSAGIPCKLELDDGDDGKVGGQLAPSDLLMLLWVCWIMELQSKGGGKEGVVVLPDVTHLVVSALVSCGQVGDDDEVWDCDVLGIEASVPAQKVKMWVMSTAPGLARSFQCWVQERIKACAAAMDGDGSILSTGVNSASKDVHDYLLTCGRAWSLSLTLRNVVSEELIGACFPVIFPEAGEKLLYRSSLHGKGLSRFWSNVEGYHGSLLILISASSTDASEGSKSTRKWIIGVVTEQGLENRGSFYGNSGYLYAISPIFRMLPPSGKDNNFVYCHLHPSASLYQPKPKPVGLAFGGAVGNERIFIDEDFSRITIRHHAVDKTYQHGSLIPNQGFLPVEASVMEVEVWGLGGKSARSQQDKYKKRETLFSEQRRKVDLKTTFGTWDESPEKMMMGMVSDPNRVQREDR